MKTILSVIAIGFISANAFAETETLSSAVQKGLFEEEVNRDFRAAIDAYESAVERFDRDRQLAATALFRLAENYRRAGRSQEAEALYERVAREFHDQTELAERAIGHLPEERLNALGAGVAGVPDDEEQREIERLRQLRRESPDRFYDGQNLLSAIQSGRIKVAEFLIEQGHDPNAVDSGNSLLFDAIAIGSRPAVELLLKSGADAMSRFPRSEETPLHSAAQGGHMAIGELLLDHSADVNATAGPSGATPLSRAVYANHIYFAKLLLDHGADANAATATGVTALHVAASRNSIQLTELLLEYGADVNGAMGDRSTPLHHSVASGNLRIAELLLEHGANVAATDHQGLTPADHLAPAADHIRLIENEDIARIVDLLRQHNSPEPRSYAFLSIDRQPESESTVFWDRNTTITVAEALAQAGIQLEEEQIVIIPGDVTQPPEAQVRHGRSYLVIRGPSR